MFCAWRGQLFEAKCRKKVRGPAGALRQEMEDLQIKWPNWNSINIDDGIINFGRCVRKVPKKKALLVHEKKQHWKQWLEKKGIDELKRVGCKRLFELCWGRRVAPRPGRTKTRLWRGIWW